MKTTSARSNASFFSTNSHDSDDDGDDDDDDDARYNDNEKFCIFVAEVLGFKISREDLRIFLLFSR